MIGLWENAGGFSTSRQSYAPFPKIDGAAQPHCHRTTVAMSNGQAGPRSLSESMSRLRSALHLHLNIPVLIPGLAPPSPRIDSWASGSSLFCMRKDEAESAALAADVGSNYKSRTRSKTLSRPVLNPQIEGSSAHISKQKTRAEARVQIFEEGEPKVRFSASG